MNNVGGTKKGNPFEAESARVSWHGGARGVGVDLAEEIKQVGGAEDPARGTDRATSMSMRAATLHDANLDNQIRTYGIPEGLTNAHPMIDEVRAFLECTRSLGIQDDRLAERADDVRAALYTIELGRMWWYLDKISVNQELIDTATLNGAVRTAMEEVKNAEKSPSVAEYRRVLARAFRDDIYGAPPAGPRVRSYYSYASGPIVLVDEGDLRADPVSVEQQVENRSEELQATAPPAGPRVRAFGCVASGPIVLFDEGELQATAPLAKGGDSYVGGVQTVQNVIGTGALMPHNPLLVPVKYK